MSSNLKYNNRSTVSIFEDQSISYPSETPFHPSVKYPEFNKIKQKLASTHNPVYDAVRESFIALELDKENIGTENWNPLKEYIHKNSRVLIKPNLVMHKTSFVDDAEVVLTNGSIIRAVLDYVFLVTEIEGKIDIGDSPMMPADFNKVIKSIGLDQICDYYKEEYNFSVGIVDFRIRKRKMTDAGIPKGEEYNFQSKNNFIDYLLTDSWHGQEKRYTFHKTLINADCIVNIPKLKCHKIAGITCCVKGFIGANADKNQILPHFKPGGADEGGDEYKTKTYSMMFKNWVYKSLRKGPEFLFNIIARFWYMIKKVGLKTNIGRSMYGDVVTWGAWAGNDTLWKSMADLNRIVLYGTKDGKISEQQQRKVLSVVDGIIAGEGQGPFEPNPKKCGLIICGENSFANDIVCSRLMGFDYKKMNTFIKIGKTNIFPNTSSDFPSNIDLRLKLKTLDRKLVADMFSHNKIIYSFKPAVGFDEIKISK